MYYDFKVKIPEVKGKIYERTIKGVVYINYEYDRIYKPDKKYNIPKRTTIVYAQSWVPVWHQD